MNMDKGGSWYE